MPVNPKSEQGQALRKLFPLATMPAQQFKELCTTCDVSEVPKGGFLFNIGDATESFIYLIQGTVSLESDEFILDTIKAGTDSAKFSLAHQFPRKVSARALNNVSFISLQLNVFDKTDIDYNEQENVYRVDNDDAEADASIDWLSALLQSPVFQRLPAVNLQQVLRSLEEIRFTKDQVIFQQGDVGDYCFLIKKGRCSLSRKASDRAKEIKYLELTAGDTFGEQAILTDQPRNMTVTALSDMEASRIDAEHFIEFIKDSVLKYIDYKDLEKECEKNPELMVLDIRSAAEYNKNHIEGSRNIPFFTLRLSLHELVQQQGKIVVVCADGRESDAAAFELIKHRINAVVLSGGMQSLASKTVAEIAENETDQVDEEIVEPAVEIIDSVDPEFSLQEENQILKADTQRLTSELALFKKQYKLLFKQTQKLKAALDKFQVAK
jgi:CRP-like cAMP-binding protein